MKIKNLIMGIAIFILTIFVGIYGINTFYGKAPDYDNYCPRFLDNETACVSEGGTWASYQPEVSSVKPVGGYCQYDYTNCQNELEKAEEKYYRGVFLIALPLGILVLALGALIFGLEFVGGGLMAGGVGIIIYGVGGFWQFADDWLKFLISLAGLVLIIWLAYYWTKRSERKK